MNGPTRTTYLSGLHVKATGRTWGELAANALEQLAVVSTTEGTTITVTRAPRCRRRWLIHRNQVLIGAVRRRWNGTWDAFTSDGLCLAAGVATRREAVQMIVDHADHGR
jgi:hypothetical protein